MLIRSSNYFRTNKEDRPGSLHYPRSITFSSLDTRWRGGSATDQGEDHAPERRQAPS